MISELEAKGNKRTRKEKRKKESKKYAMKVRKLNREEEERM